ncbi:MULTISPECIES: ABC transporter permease [Micromonospora]|uniref:ABC transporter permease n=1 Tax=Micromonospora sicca TaxID=2202420 RepID=A0A317DMA5_9ACTN|nr:MULTISPECIES: ABC transporter permease [unclassified Micromonospora]MBM0224631.1 ABC transporter permease [Micromonospora sp. ATA51]PWR15454.1 ABC transporter permease [Micromonospora sp. 4G51]
MSLVAYMADNAGRLLFLTQQHIELVLISVAISAVVGIGLALLTQSSPRLRHGLLSLTGTLLTIPSFALFALMIPLLGLGVAPTIAALAVYGVFPILRNTVTGIEGVDPAIVEAARGLGMSAGRRMRTVVLPLAWPVILNGIRTATIMLVATAAIGAVVRGPGLGELIFRGLERIGGANALEEVLSGVIGVMLVALVLDLLFIVIAKITALRGLNV